MQTTNVQVNTLFGTDIQYIIPLFQRHYVWDWYEQWQPLWEDIEDKARYRLSESQRQQFTHFTGAIVIQQKQTNVDEVPKYEIIDGQQRLTTFQVILCALRDVCNSSGLERIGADANRYILNQGTLLDDSGNEQYKLIPTQFDRASFISLVDGHIDSSSGRIRSTYEYFKDRIEGYVNRDMHKMLTLFRSISNDFGFVQILLDAGDEPERIFESLNARARPLLQFDLLRNNLFLRARIEQDRDRLYREYWEHFENSYWEQEVTVARRRITLSELFFQHFLMAKLGEQNVTPLFNVYQRELAGSVGVEHELFELRRYSEAYQEMIDCSLDSEIGQAMSFYKTFEITTLHPFILFVINEVGLSGSDLALVLQILESYTLRRLLCIPSSATRNYTKLFSRLIRHFQERHFDLGSFIRLLSDEQANATRWPANNEVESVLRFQSSMNRMAIRYVLYRIELRKREGNQSLETTEFVFDNRLSLEHIMPAGWRSTWSLPLATAENGQPSFDSDDRILYENLFHSEYRENNMDWETNPSEQGLAHEAYRSAFNVAVARHAILQSIGNLTLITVSLNSSLSNRPFSERTVRLFQNSLLVLNREICEHDTWDVPQITRRAGDLRDYFFSIWPSPEHFAESIGEPL